MQSAESSYRRQMKEIILKRIDVFTTNPFCGNPAGIVTNADGMSTDSMQALAAEMKMNLIEMAYVSECSGKSDFSVRFFTPDKELEISGHVMLAACYALIEEGRIKLSEGMTRIPFETLVGTIPLDVYFRTDYESGTDGNENKSGLRLDSGQGRGGILEKIMISQPRYSFTPCDIPVEDIAEVLGIDAAEIKSTGLPFVRASNEIDWLIIPIRKKETIATMRPDLIKLGMLNRKYNTYSNQIFSLDTFDSSCITYSRNFSPAMGLWEDPASASGSAGLGAYLRKFDITGLDSMVMQQGNETDSLARILVEVGGKAGDISIRVGGLAVKSIERKINPASMELV